jgi:predicted Zn finger-like uncharacterized protein
MLISCPECQTKIKAPDSMLGKKIRCKECKHVFLVQPPAKPQAVTAEKKPPAAGKPKPAPAKKAPAPAAAQESGDLDDDGKPYGVTEGGETFRCPQCAAAMESDDAIVCLECGFNTRTRALARTRRIRDITGNDKFLWLLPGILCVVAILLMVGYWCFHHFALPGIVYDNWDELLDKHPTRTKALGDDAVPWTGMFFSPAIELWMALIFAFASYKAGKFAVKRLIINPEPPEVEIG